MGQIFYCAECGEVLHKPIKVGTLENFCSQCLSKKEKNSEIYDAKGKKIFKSQIKGLRIKNSSVKKDR